MPAANEERVALRAGDEGLFTCDGAPRASQPPGVGPVEVGQEAQRLLDRGRLESGALPLDQRRRELSRQRVVVAVEAAPDEAEEAIRDPAGREDPGAATLG